MGARFTHIVRLEQYGYKLQGKVVTNTNLSRPLTKVYRQLFLLQPANLPVIGRKMYNMLLWSLVTTIPIST